MALPLAAWGAEAPEPTLPRLSDVTVASREDGTAVHIKTSSSVTTYRTEVMDAPPRLVVDLDDTLYGWRKTPLSVDVGPIQQIRGSQYRKGVSRLVIELKRPSDFAVREDTDGLVVVLGAAHLRARVEPRPAVAVPPPPPLVNNVGAVSMEVPAAPRPRPAIERVEAPVPLGVQRPASWMAQATQPTPPAPAPAAPATTAQPAPSVTVSPTGQRLISIDFKDADVVNLLRILAAESGKNIVIGEDVKGKMSISLRNVPWEQALDTILEARGLQKIEKENLIRIVSEEQLAKERESRLRAEEAKLKSDVEMRTKVAEAQLKEAEAQGRKLGAEAAAREAEARGPLSEELIRLSYADPEEVAKTLQGILGIPAEGKAITGPGVVGSFPPIAEQPFASLYGQQAPPPPAPTAPVSVSQNVLDKGLTIRAHKPTNTLFLRLFAADLERIKKIIRESLDIPLPQVKIEARMEILDRNALEQIGIQWGGLTAFSAGSQTIVGQGLQTAVINGQTVPVSPGRLEGSTTVLDPTGVVRLNPANPNLTLSSASGTQIGGLPVSFLTGLPLGANLVNLPINALPNAGPIPAAGIAFGIVGTRLNVNLALQALSEQGKTRTLARPEIVTVENNRATISLGEEIPYATISSAGTQIQFKEALLKLDVTPTVIREGDLNKIKLLVVVENNSRGNVVNLGSAGQPPAINRRKAETQVLIKEGDRLIIGGVATGVNQNTVRKVPLLGDIPVLGYLFRQKENFETGRELVVFITPSVLRDPRLAGPIPPAPPAPAR